VCWIGVRCFTVTLCFFSKIFFHPPHHFLLQGHHQNQRRPSYPMVCSVRLGNSAVAANLCLEDPIWPPLPKEGVTQWWGWPPGSMTVTNFASSNTMNPSKQSEVFRYLGLQDALKRLRLC